MRTGEVCATDRTRQHARKGPTEGSNPEPQIEPEPHRPGSETAHGVAGETTLYEDCQ